MDAASCLSALHGELAAETARLLSWEVGTEVQGRDRDGRIQQVEEITDTQGRLLTRLEAENTRLRVELSEAGHKKCELQQRVAHTHRELAVLGDTFLSVQAGVERVKGTPAVDLGGQVDRLEGVTQAVGQLRIDHDVMVKAKKEKMDEIRQQASEEAEELAGIRQELADRVSEMKEELEVKKKKREFLKSSLEDEKMELKKTALTLKSQEMSLSTAEQEFNDLSALNLNLKETIRETINIKSENSKAMEIEQVRLKKKVVEKNTELEELKVATLVLAQREVAKDDEIYFVASEIDKGQVSVTALAAEVEEKNKRLIMMESQAVDEGIVEHDMEAMKADLQALEIDRKLAESEVVGLSSVENMKDALDKENSLLEGKIQSLQNELDSKVKEMTGLKKAEDGLSDQLRSSEDRWRIETELIEAEESRELKNLRFSVAESGKQVKNTLESSERLSNIEVKLAEDLNEMKLELKKVTNANADREEELILLVDENKKLENKSGEIKTLRKNLGQSINLLTGNLKKSEDDLTELKIKDESIQIKIRKDEHETSELRGRNEELTIELSKISKKSISLNNKDLEKETTLLENMNYVQTLETEVNNLQKELSEVQETVSIALKRMQSDPMVDIPEDVDNSLSELSHETEQAQNDIIKNEKEEDALVTRLEQMETECKEVKTSFVEKVKLMKEATALLRNTQTLGQETDNEVGSKCRDLEKLKSKYCDVSEEGITLTKEKEDLMVTLDKLFINEEEIKKQCKILSEGFSRELNEVAENHAEKSREATKKRSDLQKKMSALKVEIEMEEVNIKTFAAQNSKKKNLKNAKLLNQFKDEIMKKKTMFKEKVNVLLKLEEELNCVTSKAEASTGTSRPVRETVFETRSNLRPPRYFPSTKRSYDGDQKDDRDHTVDVYSVGSSTDSDGAALAQCPAMSVTPRQPLRLGLGLVTPQTQRMEAGLVTPKTLRLGAGLVTPKTSSARTMATLQPADSRVRSRFRLQKPVQSETRRSLDEVMMCSDSEVSEQTGDRE
jgi:hypothetical protein